MEVIQEFRDRLMAQGVNIPSSIQTIIGLRNYLLAQWATLKASLEHKEEELRNLKARIEVLEKAIEEVDKLMQERGRML